MDTYVERSVSRGISFFPKNHVLPTVPQVREWTRTKQIIQAYSLFLNYWLYKHVGLITEFWSLV
jgi:hypothetical protein